MRPLLTIAALAGTTGIVLLASHALRTTGASGLAVHVQGGRIHEAAEGLPFSAHIHTENATGSTAKLSATNLPAGARFEEMGGGTARVTWTPGFNQGPGDNSRGSKKYRLPITATAAGQSSSVTLVIGVHPVDAPVFKAPLPEPELAPGESADVELAAHSPVDAASAQATENVTMELVNPAQYATGSATLTPNGPGRYTLRFIPTTADTHYLRVRLRDEFGKERVAPVVFRVGQPARAVRSGRWSDPSTWDGGRLPDGKRVLIEGQTVTIDGTHEVVELTIQNGGKLVFSRQSNTTLHLKGSLAVLGGGRLDVGTAASPIPSNVRAEIGFAVKSNRDLFKGNSAVLPGPEHGDFTRGDVGLFVVGEGAEASFHGAPKARWTRLAKDAPPGSNSLTVEGPLTGWQVGDPIVVTATQRTAAPQVLTITAVSGNTITTKEGLSSFREGSLYAYSKSRLEIRPISSRGALTADDILVPAQAAIGNLARNVVLTSTNPPDDHRAHSVFMMGGSGSIVNTEVRDLGPFPLGDDNREIFGRYATHFHKTKLGGLIRDSAIWNTPFDNPGGKLTVVHHTTGTSVENNVLFNARARAVFFEGGGDERTGSGTGGTYGRNVGEYGNILRNNLGVRTVGEEPLHNDGDIRTNNSVKRAPAVFWPRGKNIIEGNVASGQTGGGAGFYLDRQNMNDEEAPPAQYPSVFKNLEAHGNSGPGFQANGAEEIDLDHLLSWRNDGGYFQYAGSGIESRLVHNGVFFGNDDAGAFNYHSTRDRFEDNLFLVEVGTGKAGQSLDRQPIGFADTRDGHPTFRRNIFDGHTLSAFTDNAHLVAEDNVFVRNAQFLRLRGAGGEATDKGGLLRFVHGRNNTGPDLVNYPAEFRLLSRTAPRPAGATYDPPSRAWLLTAPLGRGGKIHGNVTTAEGQRDPSANVTILHGGVPLYQYRQGSTTYEDTTEDTKEGYTRLLPPGAYEAWMWKPGQRPQKLGVELAAGQEVQLPNTTLAPGLSVPAQGDAGALTVSIGVSGDVPLGNSLLERTVAWVLDAAGEVVYFQWLEGNGPKFALPPGRYEILAIHDDFRSASATVTAEQTVAELPMVPDTWDPSKRQGCVAGLVKRANGTPVGGATLQFREGGVLRRVTLTDPDGRYQLQGLPNAAHTVRVVKEGKQQEATIATLPENGCAPQDYTLDVVPGAPRLSITVPTAGSAVTGSTVDVRYQTSGDLSGASHAHFMLAGRTEVRDTDFDGRLQFTGVTPGPYTLTGWLVTSAHAEVPNTKESVTFTVRTVEPTPTPKPTPLPLIQPFLRILRPSLGEAFRAGTLALLEIRAGHADGACLRLALDGKALVGNALRDLNLGSLRLCPPPNQAPVVNAGTDDTVTLPEPANLDGTVTDDGLPHSPGTLTTTWSMDAGPGTATFTDSRSVDTTVTFSAPGTYVLRLEASDSILQGSGQMTITVTGAPTDIRTTETPSPETP